MRLPLCVGAALALMAPGCADPQPPGMPKQVYALYFPHHRTREHDGNLGAWQKSLTAKLSKARKTCFNYNPDLIDANGRHDIAATVYPLVGMRSDMDGDYQEFQILQAKTAHIDAFIVDWILPGNYGWEHAMRSLIKPARRHDFKLGVDFIASSHFDWYHNVDPSADTRQKKAQAIKRSLQYVLDHFYTADTALVVNGHPVIFLFGGTTPKEFRDIVAHQWRLPKGLKRPWFIRRATIGPNTRHMRWTYDRWAPLIDGTFGWVAGRFRLSGKKIPPRVLETYDYYIDSDDVAAYQRRVTAMNQKHFEAGQFSMRVNSACPGFDNRGCAGWQRTLWWLPREMGRTYARQWAHSVANRDKIDAVLCVTWNDYTEATVVEPTVENGFLDMEITQKYAAAFKGIASDPSGIRLPARLFELRKKCRFLARTGFDTAAATAQLDRAGMSISDGQYREAAGQLELAAAAVGAMKARVRSETVALRFPGREITAAAGPASEAGVYRLSGRQSLCLRFGETVAKRLREQNFDGLLEFEYLDQGRDVLTVLTSSARTDQKGPRHVAKLFSEVCRIKKDDTRRWIKARVRLFKVNCGFTHEARNGADFVFTGRVKLRNILFTFEVHRKIAPGGPARKPRS